MGEEDLPPSTLPSLAHAACCCCPRCWLQLLVVGLLRDTAKCRVYHRSARDLFLLEIPNSPVRTTAAPCSHTIPRHAC